MVLPPPCLFSGEQNEQAICRNDIISTCTKKRLSEGMTSEFSHITNCPNNQSRWKMHNNRKYAIG